MEISYEWLKNIVKGRKEAESGSRPITKNEKF